MKEQVVRDILSVHCVQLVRAPIQLFPLLLHFLLKALYSLEDVFLL